MKRALSALALPLTALGALLAGLAAAWRWATTAREREADAARARRIRAEADREDRARELAEMPRGRRRVADGPVRTTALSRPWSAR